MILGTAGHIDHGKTALVRALTGVDTDRLAEEKRRGITIELGFAPLVLDDGALVSIVDVPGHDRLVDTMIAGAWPLDAALLVIAATEGVMPQTREHCTVLRAFRVPVIAVALTNVDRIAPADVARIESGVRADLAACGVGADVPLIHTVPPRGDGIETVRAAIAAARARVPPRDADDLARFVVDRAFTLRGIGTVATGTLVTGRLDVGDRVRVLPDDRESRIRGLHAHGADVDAAHAGGRFALALADVASADVERGACVVADGRWRGTTRILVRLDAVAERMPRGASLHVACTSARARIRILDAEHRVVRVALDRPVVARAGDRVLVRTGSGAAGIVGGEVVDPLPDRHLPACADGSSPAARLEALAAVAAARGIDPSALPLRLGLPPAGVDDALRVAAVVPLGDRIVSREVLAGMERRVVALVEAWCREHPFAPGVSIGELGTLANLRGGGLEGVVATAVAGQRLSVAHGLVSLASSTLAADAAGVLARVLHSVTSAGLELPSTAELARTHGAEVDSVLRHAERAGNLIRIGGVRWCAAPVLARAIEQLRSSMQSGRAYSPSELRAVLGVSRKYLIPLLEYCDTVGVTERRSGGRVLRDVSSR